MQHGLFTPLRHWSETWVQVQQACQAWRQGYGWLLVLGLVGLARVVLLAVRGRLPRARAFPPTEAAYVQRSPAWKGVPRVPGPAIPDGWREWSAYVGGAVMCAVVLGVMTRYGSLFPHLPLSFPMLTLR
jgi:hypothetical protein